MRAFCIYTSEVNPPSSAAASVVVLLALARSMDESGLRAELRSQADERGVDEVVTEVVLPFLHAVGVAWERGEHSVASEHFASQVVRSWLVGDALSGGFDPATDRAPLVLACPPGERHDLGLLCFHVLLLRARVPSRFLGSDTPLPGLADVCRIVGASGVVVAATRRRVIEANGGALRALARQYPVVIGGAGADDDLAERVHATALPADMRLAIQQVVSWRAAMSPAA